MEVLVRAEEDRVGDYNVDPDYDGPVYHVIKCASGWEGCNGSHEKVWQVKECFVAAQAGHFPCDWLVEFRYDDGSRGTRSCGRPAWPHPDDVHGGFQCAGGHEHISQETRIAEGWEYAEDEGEALALAKAGVEPRTMDYGQIWPR